jgi:hypothetical protein
MNNGRIGKQASRILSFLWTLAKENGGSLKLDNSNGVFIPLSIEILSENEISLAHYVVQGGDACADPEMIFWSCQDSSGDYEPLMYKNDLLGIEEHCREEDTHEDYMRQIGQAKFARVWLKNIKIQQELQLPKPPKKISLVSLIFGIMFFIYSM